MIKDILNNMKKKTIRLIATIALVLGSLLFVLIGAAAAWGDIESTLFNNTRSAPGRLTTLNCPAFITTDETAYISARIINETNKDTLFKIRAFITDGNIILLKEIDSDVPLGPYESMVIEWPVIAENAAFDRVILARVHQLENSPHPYRNASCGIVVVGIPFLTGTQLVYLGMGLGLVSSAAGLWFWNQNATPHGWRNSGFRRRTFFTGAALLLAVTGLMGYWALATIILVVWITLVIEVVWHETITTHKSPIDIENEK